MRLILKSVLLFFLMMLPVIIHAQDISDYPRSEVQCGDIIEDEFQGDGDVHAYSISLEAGSQLNVRGVPLGDTLKFLTAFYDTDDVLRYVSSPYEGWSHFVESQPTFQTGVLSASGEYTIIAYNNSLGDSAGSSYRFKTGDSVNMTPGGSGIFTLFVNCTLRDGTVIEAGATLTDDSTSDESDPLPPASQPDFSGFGFPGLAPVDMSDVARIPMTMGVPFTGAVTPTGSVIPGYTFEGTTDQRVDLSVERLSGNLNLGVVMIDSESSITYFSALVTSETMTTRLRIPTDGEYIVGVFRLELLALDNPEATAFSVQIEPVE